METKHRRPPLVAFVGLAGSGKTTAALHLATEWGFRRDRFAATLKDMLRCLGLTDEELDGDRKNTPHPLLGGKTPRHVMQTLGTEWGREMVSPTLWLDAFTHRLAQHGGFTVCDDVRFPNEADLIRQHGGVVVRIERPGLPVLPGQEGQHASEAGQARIRADITLRNNAGVPEFKLLLRSLMVNRWGFTPAAMKESAPC